jgi:hypothetical protein
VSWDLIGYVDDCAHPTLEQQRESQRVNVLKSSGGTIDDNQEGFAACTWKRNCEADALNRLPN